MTDAETGNSYRKYVQSTFYYVSIEKQLESLFSNEEFRRAYVNYNEQKSHECTDGVYRDFCCGSNYRQKKFFSENPMAVQLQLFTDDFEPCDALKSRASVHKTCAFYFQIRNLPVNLLSKLNHIYLVALCNTNDLKTEYTSMKNILEVILNEVKTLETVGISANGISVKGTLVNVSFDNLGGNVCFGYSEGFRANYFCRICESHRDECQKITIEDVSTIRTKDEYNRTVAFILANESEKCDLTSTKGIKKYCVLNDCNHFHILENLSVDLMHDLHEGVIPFLLHHLFEHIVKNKIIRIERLENMVQFFNYGTLSKKNKPSKINVGKKSIGQSAHQSYCLMVNLPFILIQFKSELSSVWKPVETLLQIMQIVFSEKIDENDLIRLSALIDSHLSSIIDIFGVTLIPKHHFLLHYPRVIRAMGPVIFMWTMRMEAKHHFFKQLIHKKKNFVNVLRTMSVKHQEMQCTQSKTYGDTIEHGKMKVSLIDSEDYDKYSLLFEQENININESFIINSLNVNSTTFKPGLLIVVSSIFFQIEHVVLDSNRYWFLCSVSYDLSHKDLFCNSFVLKKRDETSQIFNYFNLDHKKSYEITYVNDEIHVKAENLYLNAVDK